MTTGFHVESGEGNVNVQAVRDRIGEDVTLPPAELREMTAGFGDKVFQMGNLEQDGSMLVPVDCIVEVAGSIGTRTLIESADTIHNEQMVSM